MGETWNCSELVDGQVFRVLLFLFSQVNDFGFKLESTNLKKSKGSSTRLTDRVEVKCQGHIFDEIISEKIIAIL